MRDLIKIIVWFFVINFSICNHIWTEPVSYWWIIEIIILIISILMVDKHDKKQYNKYKIKKERYKAMRDYFEGYITIHGWRVLESAYTTEELNKLKAMTPEELREYMLNK